MPEWLNKFQIINIIAIIIILTSSYIAITTDDDALRNKYLDMCLVGLVGWAFTRSQKSAS